MPEMSLALLLSIDKRRPISSLLSTPQLAMTSVHCMLGRILGPASSFVMAVLLARSFGAAGSGTFFVVLTLVTAFAIVAKFGLETALQRFIGAEKARDNAAAIVGIYQQSLRASLALAALLAGLWIALASSIASSVLDDPTLLGLLRLMGLLIVPFTVLGINAAMLKALGSPAWGGFFEAAAWPLVTLSLAVLGSINGPPSIEAIGLAYLLAATLAAATAHAVVHIKLPRVPKALAMSSRTLYTSCATLT
ncbi:MAG: O-antigen/teichoic acid export membrane protein, partial [Gammaproteobacteria bacterium]